MGELCFSPIGLSSMTRLSVTRMTGLMMGTWFLATAVGNFIAALIAQATGAAGAGPDTILTVYTRIGGFSMVVGLGVIALRPLVVRLMHLGTIADTSDSGDSLAI